MPQKPKWPWITLIVLHGIQLLTLIPWIFMSGLVVMAFDSPGSDKMWQPWAWVMAIWSYPAWLVAAGITSWVLLGFRYYWTAILISGAFTFYLPAAFAVLLFAG